MCFMECFTADSFRLLSTIVKDCLLDGRLHGPLFNPSISRNFLKVFESLKSFGNLRGNSYIHFGLIICVSLAMERNYAKT